MAAVLIIIPLTERDDRGVVEGSADWMAALDDDLPLNRITIPGTHDSATQYVQLAFFSKCQAKDIAGQLEAGYRYLDIRLGVDEHNGIFKLMYGFTNCKTGPMPWNDALYLDWVLEDCYEFLAKHPGETVIFAVKQEHGDAIVAEFQQMLDAYIRENPEYWLLTDAIPTLGEARGKLVLMRRYADEAGLGEQAGIPLIWPDQPGSENTSLSTAMTENGSYRLWVQDRYEYGVSDKWAAFLNGMQEADTAEGDISLNFLSTKGTLAYGHPWHFARILNAHLMTQNFSEDDFCGWVIVDFGTSELAARLWQRNIFQ